MNPWCTPDDVISLLSVDDVDVRLMERYIAQASRTMFILSGRRFPGTGNVVAEIEVDRRAYVRLREWIPVNTVSLIEVAFPTPVLVFAPVTGVLSAGGTYLALDRQYARYIARVTMNVGQDRPQDGILAAAALAADMIRGDPQYAEGNPTPPTDVRPSARLRSITRQGVTYSYADSDKLMESGLTGVYETDLFLRGINPHGARYQSKVVTT